MKNFLLALLFCAASAAAQDSRIELRSSPSAALGIIKSYNIYLPKDYDKSTERYPVIYLFRGHEREWANPTEDGSRQGRTVKDDADACIASGTMGNVILVMPGMSSSDNAIATVGVNMLAADSIPNANKGGIGTGRFEDYLVRDLIPYIDSAYRTLPSRHFRAVDGFSLGGQTSMMLAVKHPELFCSAGSFDGTLMWLDFRNPAAPGAINDLWATNSMFDALFNKPRDIPYMTQYNASNIVRDASVARAAALKQMQFLLRATPGGNDDRTNGLLSLLAEKGIANGFAEVPLTPTAHHNWYYADLYVMQSFPKHWEKFQSSAVSQDPDSLRVGIHQLESEQYRWEDLRLVKGVGAFVHGKACAVKGDLKQAIVEFQKGAKKNRAAAYYNIGLTYFHMHEYETAIQYFKRSEKIRPDVRARGYRLTAGRLLKEKAAPRTK